ncbi:SDR family oxidoreductase [Pseudomonas helleri]|uniref:SDR family NAD(P)-dependent oxidoreductase n=1 Tax=Pseudomonas helleri TaxID=1608996 RepID=A0A6L5HQV1_9PSED|nr:SDR family oxidoreductase [Pseudomonas helleri]MQU05746.1 SDR family NAD(P)-dependent oxidoreductase [Pseudomonas helleri]
MKRVALVTGASSGIGQAIAGRFAKDGMQVLATGRRQDELEKLAGEYPSVIAQTADLNMPLITKQLLETAKSRFGISPSVVVLSAGRGLKGSLLTSDSSQWQEMVDINLLSVMKQMRETAQFLLSNLKGESPQDIVILGSTVGRTLSAANPVYGATKFALHSLCESLRQELCVHAIRVTLIEPGFVKSGFQDSAGYDRQWFKDIEAESGPFLVPEDIAATVSFVVAQPPHVHLDDIRIRPTRQKV